MHFWRISQSVLAFSWPLGLWRVLLLCQPFRYVQSVPMIHSLDLSVARFERRFGVRQSLIVLSQCSEQDAARVCCWGAWSFVLRPVYSLE